MFKASAVDWNFVETRFVKIEFVRLLSLLFILPFYLYTIILPK